MEATRRFAGVILAVVIMAAASPALGAPPLDGPDSLDPNCGVVLSGSSARILTDTFLSRRDLGALWDPTPAEISQLEEALGRELSNRLRSLRTPTNRRVHVRDYFRQYAGIHLNGRRLIFVNGFHRAYVDETTEWLALPHPESQLTYFPADARNREFWRKVPVHVDDGGAFFFMALYDPQSRRIVGFQFNGVG